MVRTQAEVREIATIFGRKLSELFDDVEIRLFGSYYRNEAKDGSDIDLAVISSDFCDMDYILSLKILNRIKNSIAVDIEPISLTPEELSVPQIGSISSYIAKGNECVYIEKPRTGTFRLPG